MCDPRADDWRKGIADAVERLRSGKHRPRVRFTSMIRPGKPRQLDVFDDPARPRNRKPR
jgi:hypothetical protein